MRTRFLLPVVTITLVACHREPAPPTVPGSVASPSQPVEVDLARGSYLAALSGCVVCHSAVTGGVPDKDRPFAGGLEVKPASGGVWKAPNITPDTATGVGAWTDAQIASAIRTGIRSDGTRLMPIMPYPYYHAMTDGDVRAVVGFLRAQKPVYNAVARSEGLSIPPVDLAEPIGNIDPVDDPKAHGEYLANLMHCAACHTARSGAHAGEPFSGGFAFDLPDGRAIVSPNITSDMATGIGSWTADQVIQTIRTMKHPRGMPIEGPMAMYGDGWATLTDRDALALATFVKSIPPVHNQIPDRFPAVTSTP